MLGKNNKLKNYIIWLQEYTIKNYCFTTTTYLYKYKEKDLSKKEITNIGRLCQLFEIIDKYSQENYIYPQINESGTYYRIKYNNIGYHIGHFSEEDPTIHFCIRVRLDPQKEYIDFNNIIENKPLPRSVQLKQELQHLSNLIHTLSDHNIPLEAISDTVDEAIKKIKQKKLNNSNKNK